MPVRHLTSYVKAGQSVHTLDTLHCTACSKLNWTELRCTALCDFLTAEQLMKLKSNDENFALLCFSCISCCAVLRIENSKIRKWKIEMRNARLWCERNEKILLTALSLRLFDKWIEPETELLPTCQSSSIQHTVHFIGSEMLTWSIFCKSQYKHHTDLLLVQLQRGRISNF